MQQTPLQPCLQLNKYTVICGQQIANGDVTFTGTVVHQAFEQLPNLTHVYAIAGLLNINNAEQGAYVVRRFNIHVAMCNGVHGFFSLRYQSDFSLEVAHTPLIEAEQLNFWKVHSSQPYNLHSTLDTAKTVGL